MTILLDNVYSALEQDLINKDQALYLIYTEKSIAYPISAVDLFALTKMKYIVGGRIGKELYVHENVKLALSGTIKPIYTNEISKGIPKKLCKLLCMTDPVSGSLRLPGGEDSITYTAERYLGGEGLISYHYIIFLFMFPVAGEYNKRWEKHFTGFEYKGARLRVRSKGTATAFKRIVKQKDMGIFLYGTYLFIQSCIRENKTFVKTITNYTKEYQEWYDEAEEKIKKAKDVESLFRVTAAKEGRLNVSI